MLKTLKQKIVFAVVVGSFAAGSAAYADCFGGCGGNDPSTSATDFGDCYVQCEPGSSYSIHIS